MSYYVDLQYIPLAGRDLNRFQKKNAELWTFRCPECGDSEKSKNKTRGYFYRKADQFNFRCHNCEAGSSFKNFLRKYNATLFQDYIMEFSKGKSAKPAYIPLEKPKEVDLERSGSFLEHLTRIDTLEQPNPVSDALNARKIPQKQWDKLYYCNRFKEFSNMINPGIFSNLYGDCPRLGIPFFTEDGKPFLFSFRAFDNAEPKYLHIKVAGIDHPKIYGLERVDWSKTVYLTEGPLDSLFLPNAIAVGGGHLLQDKIVEHKDSVVIVPDNEPRNPTTVKNLQKAIDAGFKMVVYPHRIAEKDVNDMVLGGMNEETLLAMIEGNTFSGSELRFRFSHWKKC